MRKSIRIVILIIAAAMLFGCPVSAEEYDYTINGEETVAIPKSYIYLYSINRLNTNVDSNAYLNQPSTMVFGKDGYLYIADTGNNRIVKLSRGGTAEIIKSAGDKPLKEPQGIYALEDGSVYISDTGNGRIVYLNSAGELVKEYGLPESTMLSDVTVFAPTKIAPAPNGGLYVLMGETFMQVDENNEFQGYLGQIDIGFNFTDALLRLIASEKQKSAMAKRTASNYISFCMGDDGIIYATSFYRGEGEIKALNSVGINVYRKYGSIDGESNPFRDAFYKFFSGNILGKSFRYGEVVEGTLPTLSGIAVDKNGVVTVIEKENGKIYQYDRNGNLLTVFGGLGTSNGTFGIPADVAVDSDGRIYVLDSSYGNIQVFEPTDFIKTVQAAATAYYNGDYTSSDEMWNKVLETDSLYPLAHYGIGMTAYKSGDYKKAMEKFSFANYRTEYSKAFTKYRFEYMKNHFGLVVVILIAAAVLLLVLIKLLMKRSGRVLYGYEYGKIRRLSVGQGLWLGVACCFHPVRTIQSMKNTKKRLNLVSALIFVVLAIAARFFFVYTVHYPLQDVELYSVSIVTETVKLLLPVFTWTAAVYLITSQVNGEATFGETLIANIYCFVPYIFVIPFSALLSRVISTNETMLFAFLVNGVILISVCYLFRAVMILNDYSVGKTFAVCIFSVIVMVLLWFVFILLYTMAESVIDFIKSIFTEVMFIV